MNKISSLILYFSIVLIHYGQNDTSFIYNEYKTNGTVYLEYTPKNIYDIGFSLDKFVYRDTLNHQNYNGTLIGFSKKGFSLSTVVDGRPVGAKIFYRKLKLAYLIYYPVSKFQDFTIFLNRKGNIKSVTYHNPFESNRNIRIQKRKYIVTVIDNVLCKRERYKTKEIDVNIKLVFRVIEELGLKCPNDNCFIAEEFELTEKMIEQINQLR